MTDRELLKNAAIAIGMPKAPMGSEIQSHWPILFVLDGKEWNPLTDDGDALRLAVKLEILASRGAATYKQKIFVEGDVDHCAATRRAIVRAAAAIGETL